MNGTVLTVFFVVAIESFLMPAMIPYLLKKISTICIHEQILMEVSIWDTIAG